MTAGDTVGGSRDPRTGQCFFPARALSVDGALRDLEPVELPAQGQLAEFIGVGDKWFGYVDLPGEVRVLTELGPGPHEVGTRYVLASSSSPRRFDRA